MADPQTEHGHIRIATELYEQLGRHDFSKLQLKIIWYVLRHSYGCHRKVAYIPRLNLFEIYGADLTKAQKEIDKLISMRVLEHDFLRKEYRFNKDYDKWKCSPVSHNHIKNPVEDHNVCIAENIRRSQIEDEEFTFGSNSEFILSKPKVDTKSTLTSIHNYTKLSTLPHEVDEKATGESHPDLINLISSKIPDLPSSMQEEKLIGLERRLGADVALAECEKCIAWYREKTGELPFIRQIIAWLEKAWTQIMNQDGNEERRFEKLEDMRSPSGRQLVDVNALIAGDDSASSQMSGEKK